MLIAFGLLLIIIVFIRFSKPRDKNVKERREEFWKNERASQFVPRKDISSLDYITIPYSELPFRYWRPGSPAPVRIHKESTAPASSESVTASDELSVHTEEIHSDSSASFSAEDSSYLRAPEYAAPLAEELAGAEYELCSLSEKKILNLVGISNTELRLTYGTANLDPLTSYDQNFTVLIRTLQKWGTLLVSSGQSDDAVTVLAYAVSVGSDIAGTYTLLARLYKGRNELDKIEELKASAEQLSTLMKPSILRDLEQLTDSSVL